MRAIVIPAATVTVELEDMPLDLVCYEYLFRVLRDRREAGRLRGYVEATLSANHGLADKGLILPLGTVINMPEFVIEERGVQTRRLWDEP